MIQTTNSHLQISTLKENLTRADCEVAELDRLVDQVREVSNDCTRIFDCSSSGYFPIWQVLHANIGHVKKCKPLLCLLQELDGSEAPDTY